MPPLHELQSRMMTALLEGTPEAAAHLVAAPAGGTAPAGRAAATARAALQLGVYANTLRSNFEAALRSTYPAILRLVGEEYFRQVARGFQRRRPSLSGDLNQAGEHFPAYLAGLHAADDFRYLGDVARLEWLIQEALLAAEHAPLDLQKMAGVAPSAYDGLRFELHPSLRLFASPYPALRIWKANVGEAEPGIIDLGDGPVCLMVMRHRARLQFENLSAGEYRLLAELQRGMPFAAAIDAAAACDERFEATLALQRFVAAEALVDCL